MARSDISTPENLRVWLGRIPHHAAIGFELVEAGPDHVLGRVPYRESLVGDPASGVVHGGIVTTLLDTVGGAAVFARYGEFVMMATLDLRIDYLRPSTPHEDLYGRVECYKLTRNVAFTRGFACNEDPQDPLASMSATYMLNTPAARPGAPGRKEPVEAAETAEAAEATALAGDAPR